MTILGQVREFPGSVLCTESTQAGGSPLVGWWDEEVGPGVWLTNGDGRQGFHEPNSSEAKGF